MRWKGGATRSQQKGRHQARVQAPPLYQLHTRLTAQRTVAARGKARAHGTQLSQEVPRVSQVDRAAEERKGRSEVDHANFTGGSHSPHLARATLRDAFAADDVKASAAEVRKLNVRGGRQARRRTHLQGERNPHALLDEEARLRVYRQFAPTRARLTRELSTR